MKTSWPTKKLGEVCEINPKTQLDPRKKRIKYVEMAAIDENFKEIKYFLERPIDKISSGSPRFKDDDVIFARITPCTERGKMAYIRNCDEVCVGSTEFHVLRARQNELLSRFLFYYLCMPKVKNMAVASMTGSTGRQRVPAEFFQYIKILLPPLKIQHQIVERLDAIKKAQELNDKQIALAEELFQSLLDRELEIKDEDWELRRLEEVCEKIQQIHPKKIFKKEFRYIDIESIDSKTNTIIETKKIEVDKAPSRARKLVKEGDTIFATTRPYLKNIAYIYKELDNSICSTGFCVIRGKRDLVESSFLFFLSLSNPFISRVLIYQRGASYPAVPDSSIYNLKITLPPLETQRQIVEKLQAIQDYKKKLLEQKQKLQELFNSCLDKAMKGELIR